MNPVLGRLPVEDDEPEFRVTASLVDEHGTSEVNGGPHLVDVLVQGGLKKVIGATGSTRYPRAHRITSNQTYSNSPPKRD